MSRITGRSVYRAALMLVVAGPALSFVGAASAQDSDAANRSGVAPECVEVDGVDGEPWCVVDVVVELDVIDVPRVDERERLVELEATIVLAWYDERLEGECGPDEVCVGGAATDKLASIWRPDIEFRRGIGPRTPSNLAVTVSCGLVIYQERFLAAISQDFADLNDFPFDRHDLTFTLLTFAQGNDTLRIVKIDQFFGADRPACEGEEDRDDRADAKTSRFTWENDEWDLDKDDEFDRALIINPFFQPGFQYPASNDFEFQLPDGQLREFEKYFADPSNDRTYYGDPDGYRPSTTFTVAITRKSNFYVYNIVLPLVLIVAISWVVFWGNIGKMTLAERLGVSITSLLTVVAFDFLTGDSLPRLSYTTRLDVFYNFSYLFVALTVVVSIVSTRMASRGSPARVKSARPDEAGDPEIGDDGSRRAEEAMVEPSGPTSLDWHCRWIFPVAYAAAVAVSMMGWLSRGESWL